VLIVPPVVALTRFGFFVSEPRYDLAAVQRSGRCCSGTREMARLLGLTIVALLTVERLQRALNGRCACGDPKTRSTAPLPRALSSSNSLFRRTATRCYTDYWIGYPIMFETRETVLAYVISGGFNRYVPPAITCSARRIRLGFHRGH